MPAPTTAPTSLHSKSVERKQNGNQPATRRHRGGARLNLALQGGGAHGAFTWGVLDRLLEDEDIEFGRISGTSAGALNGAALASGFAQGGRAGARKNLEKLWSQVAQVGVLMSMLLVPLKKPGLGIWDDAMPLLSPYQTNPLSLEPLRSVLASVVDETALRSSRAPPLYVNAVNVNTGLSRVFGPAEVSMATLLASACAPLMFPAVEIDNESYWDGSYAGNPMLWPLYEGDEDTDILMVELTPLVRLGTPRTAKNILNRINEIASINGVVAEMRALELVNQARLAAGEPRVRMHVLSLPDNLSDGELEPSTKRTVGPLLFDLLRRKGYGACSKWLAADRGALGIRSTVDIASRYLAPYRHGKDMQAASAPPPALRRTTLKSSPATTIATKASRQKMALS